MGASLAGEGLLDGEDDGADAADRDVGYRGAGVADLGVKLDEVTLEP